MNYKQFINKVRETGKAVLIDEQKAKRGYNNVRILRFFFCSKEGLRKQLDELVEQKNAIGFYVTIEKNNTFKDYWITIQLIDKQQNIMNAMFYENNMSATELYNQALEKIKETLTLKAVA